MAARPRLLLLTPDFPPARGGIQVLTHRLACGLDGFETRVVTLSTAGSAAFDASGKPSVRRVPGYSSMGPARLVPLSLAALEEARRFRPDVTLSAHIVTSAASALIRWVLGSHTLQYFYAKEIGAKPRLSTFAAREAQDVVAISGYTLELLREVGAQVHSSHLIPPGVDRPTVMDPLPTEHPTFLTVARLEDRYKGHDVLIRALPLIRAKVPDVRWVVIGDGPLRKGLEEQARSYGVFESIRFLGAVDDETRNAWLRRAALLAMPSRLPAGDFAGEGFGIVYLEAATYEKPSVAGNVGGALDAVVDGETGLLVDPGDHLAVAGAITRLLCDPELTRSLGRQGARRAQHFAWPAICARLEAVLMNRIDGGSRRDRGHATSDLLDAPR